MTELNNLSRNVIYADTSNYNSIVFPIENTSENDELNVKIESIHLQSIMNTIDINSNAFTWVERRKVADMSLYYKDESGAGFVYVLCCAFIKNGYYKNVTEIIDAINVVLNGTSAENVEFSTTLDETNFNLNLLKPAISNTNAENRILQALGYTRDETTKDITRITLQIKNSNEDMKKNNIIYSYVYPCKIELNTTALIRLHDYQLNRTDTESDTFTAFVNFSDHSYEMSDLEQAEYELSFSNKININKNPFVINSIHKQNNLVEKLGLGAFELSTDLINILESGILLYNYNNGYNYFETVLNFDSMENSEINQKMISSENYSGFNENYTETSTISEIAYYVVFYEIERFPMFPIISNFYVNQSFISDISMFLACKSFNIIKTINLKEYFLNGLISMDLENNESYQVFPLVDNTAINLTIPAKTTYYIYITSDLFAYPIWRSNHYLVYYEL